ncbi:ABC transporter ATP-binding protein [Virgibacillus siamensis]|uniref:ABC transporter ATP-binding protein n=1 Tax=Virgibacillus siamensis TaxID=480071 RepID=UPI000987A788|nr:dipeptide ABC transporter ATP-binding protein [Virgibacillus siamensis]
MSEILLKVNNLKKYFPITGGVLNREVGTVKAVDGVSFTLEKGTTLGLVGESGCGKTTVGRMILRLIEPSDGTVSFQDVNLTELSKGELRNHRRDIQMVFQDPFASLNPRQTAGKIIEEPLKVHGMDNTSERRKRVNELLEIVGLHTYHAKRYPHQFSGGQRQRIGIARALAVHPKLIVADEPVSALDVSIQSQVLNLLKDLQKRFDLTYIFIAHDLSVVRHISDRVGVMYLGRLVEMSDCEMIYEQAKHPYTQALLSAVPVPDPDYEQSGTTLEGSVPSASSPPSGCAFHTRCPLAMDVCSVTRPELKDVGTNHYVACHLYDEE